MGVGDGGVGSRFRVRTEVLTLGGLDQVPVDGHLPQDDTQSPMAALPSATEQPLTP